MENLLYYLLRASVSMALLYGFYKLFFGKNTFHAINRFVLIAVPLERVAFCRLCGWFFDSSGALSDWIFTDHWHYSEFAQRKIE